jgi:hypothetical protein
MGWLNRCTEPDHVRQVTWGRRVPRIPDVADASTVDDAATEWQRVRFAWNITA